MKKSFGQDASLVERDARRAYLQFEGDRVRRLTIQIIDAEREIDRAVHGRLQLTSAGIALIDRAAAAQRYPMMPDMLSDGCPYAKDFR